jgi:ornithine--oxo-acid transaminase
MHVNGSASSGPGGVRPSPADGPGLPGLPSLPGLPGLCGLLPGSPSLTGLLRENSGRQFELHDRYVNPAFRKMLRMVGMDTDYVRAEGTRLYDAEGREYLDFLTHSGVFSLGHNHPHVNARLREVLDGRLPNILLMDCSLLSGLVAERLLATVTHLAPAGAGKVFFANSGAEAVEAAVKFARASTGRPRVVSFVGAYHGLTYGALSVVGHEMWREGFGPFLPGCVQVPFGDAEAVARELARGDVACVLGETIQGDGGVNLPPEGFWPAVAEECRRRGTLLVLDEIQVGLGRTGRLHAFEHYRVQPDLVLLGKGLSGGQAPVSAVLMRDEVCRRVFNGVDRCVIHSGTYNENNLSMAAALATLEVIEAEGLVARAAATGERFLARLRRLVGRHELVKDVRGLGLLAGIEFGRPKSFGLRLGWDVLDAVSAGLFPQMVLVPLHRQHRVLCQIAGHNMRVIKLMPPLNVTDADCDLAADALDSVLAEAHRFPGSLWDFGRGMAERMTAARGE